MVDDSFCHEIFSASPFNITIIQVYALTSSYDDSEVDEFYRELQSLVDQTPKPFLLTWAEVSLVSL